MAHPVHRITAIFGCRPFRTALTFEFWLLAFDF
jgi:hypothetical protein